MVAFPTALLACALALTNTLTAHAALSPRASPSAGDLYFRPAYTCPSSITVYGTPLALSDGAVRTDSPTLICEYGSDTDNSCVYNTATGALLVTGTGCPSAADATSGCIYECALTETGGSDLIEAYYLYSSGESVQCVYWTGSQWLYCLYGNAGTLQGSSGVSTGHGCPDTASYQCDASQRRGYRGVDNYTAWLARRAARKAREAAPAPAPAPAPAAAPMVRRKYAVDKRG